MPSPWTSTDIGSPVPTGSASYNTGTYTVHGSGADIWGTADSFRYVYRPMTGDGSIVAKVESVSNTNSWAKAGIMMRSSLADGASNVLGCVTPGNSFALQARASNNAVTSNTVVSAVGAPCWARITRSGDIFTVSRSSDGVTWTTVGTATITMPATIYIGLAVTSHASGSLCTATFSNVSP